MDTSVAPVDSEILKSLNHEKTVFKSVDWSPNRVWVPREEKVSAHHTAFSTHDRDIYIRDTMTGEIRRQNPKPKGKKARRGAKKLRRLMREHMAKTASTSTDL